MHKLYKTFINTDGSYFDMEVLFINNEEEYQKLLNRSLKTCEEVSGVFYNVSYTKIPLYLSKDYQKNIVYHIANANRINTYKEFMECLNTYYPEFKNLLNSSIIIEELNLMYNLQVNTTKLYPKMKRIIEVKHE